MKKSSTHNTVDFTRRSLLLGLAAAPFFFNSAWAIAPKSPEVVIIGAGAAGLGAAKTLSDLGISFLLIEAQSHIGGRAYTDHYTSYQLAGTGCESRDFRRDHKQ